MYSNQEKIDANQEKIEAEIEVSQWKMETKIGANQEIYGSHENMEAKVDTTMLFKRVEVVKRK
jgi:hypothetical protein